MKIFCREENSSLDSKMKEFHFKQFSICQDNAVWKVGTDGVVLGAWAKITGAENILDIGTGTGIIALMCAQRNTEAEIDALEIDENTADEARRNADNSPWSERIRIINSSIETFKPDKTYDHIVSNPPYFIESASTPSPDKKRRKARHCHAALFEIIIDFSVRHTETNGKLSVVLPVAEAKIFLTMANIYGLHPSRITYLIPNPGKPVKRFLIELEKKEKTETTIDRIIIENFRNDYHPSYRSLTSEFHPHL